LSISNHYPELSPIVAVWQGEAVTFKERLRASMEQRGWNQKTLAEASGLTESAVSRHLERDDAPRADSLKKYAEALDVSVAWLGFGRTETPPAQSATFPAIDPDATGLAALAMVLRDYPWPDHLDMTAIDAAEAEARQAAATPAGLTRSPSAWRAYLDRSAKKAPAAQTQPARRRQRAS
jgi:transcriptional regulator with XRE-family HTH domain